MKDVNKKMAKGAAWMVVAKIVERGIGLVSTIILARLLVPADFGLVALAMVIIAILEMLGAFSFDIMLIQRQHADRSYYDTAWTFDVIVGLVSGLALALLARPAAAFYSDARLESIIYVLILYPVVTGFTNIGVVAFRKDMEFHKEFKYVTARKLISFTVTLIMALTFRNYWALVVGNITGRSAGVVLSYLVHPYRPKLSLSRRHEMFHFSKWLFLNNIINFFNTKATDMVIGKLSGARALGLFSIAFEISNMPTTELVAPINRAVFPGYAKMSEDVSTLRAGYFDVLGLITLLSVPIALGIAATSDIFVPLVLGAKWIETIPLIQILAFNGLLYSLQSNIGTVYIVMNRPHIITLIMSIYSVVLVSSLIVGVRLAGSVGAAFGLLICTVFLIPANLHFAGKLLQLHFHDFVSVMWRPFFAGITMYAAVYLQKLYIGHAGSDSTMFAELLLMVITGAVVYCGMVISLWLFFSEKKGAERVVLDYVLKRFSHLRLFQFNRERS